MNATWSDMIPSWGAAPPRADGRSRLSPTPDAGGILRGLSAGQDGALVRRGAVESGGRRRI